MPGSSVAKIIKFPDLKPGDRKALMGAEIGTSFDYGQKLFAYFGSGDVFDYGEWGARDMKTMFKRDGQCSAIELVLTLPIREADKSIEPAKADNGEAEMATSVLMTPDTEGGMQTPMEEFIGQVTSGQIYRKAFFEKVWKIRDSDQRVVIDKLAYRPPATCQSAFNEKTGAKNGFRQLVWLFGANMGIQKNQKVPGYVDIPKIRSAIYTHGTHREPLIGVSEMEIAYWCYQTKMKLLYLWYNYLENLALPRTIVYGNDQPEANTRADDIASLRGSGVVGLVHPEPGQKAFETMPGEAQAGNIFKEALGFLEQWQIGSVLAGFMGLTGAATGGKGSFALSQDQSSFYLKSRQGVAKEMAAWISAEIIAPMIILNFGPNAAFPTFKFGPLQDEQIQALLTLFGQIVAAPALHIPIEFVDLLAERMASVLQLDIDQVHTALVNSAAQRSAQLAGAAGAPPGMPPSAVQGVGALNGVANTALNIAQQAQGGQPLPGQPPVGSTKTTTSGPPAAPAGLRPPPPRQSTPGPPRPPGKPAMVPPAGKMA
jgi:hypothetical protein